MQDLLFEYVPINGLPETDRVVLTNRNNHFLIRIRKQNVDVNADGVNDQLNLKSEGWLCDALGVADTTRPIPGRVDSMSLELLPTSDDVANFVAEAVNDCVFRGERMVAARAAFDMVPA